MNYKTVKMSELLTRPQAVKITKLINGDHWTELRDYLFSIETDLALNKMLPGYLYYYLEYKFRGTGIKMLDGVKYRGE